MFVVTITKNMGIVQMNIVEASTFVERLHKFVKSLRTFIGRLPRFVKGLPTFV